jgi:hypothetical protein
VVDRCRGILSLIRGFSFTFKNLWVLDVFLGFRGKLVTFGQIVVEKSHFLCFFGVKPIFAAKNS